MLEFLIEYMLNEQIELLSSFKQQQLSTNIIDRVESRITAALADPRFHKSIAPYFSNRNAEGVPFTHYAEDPDNVSQIKKLINALYYARLAFVGLENLDLSNWQGKRETLKHLLGDIVENGYEAAFLATHLDVNIQEMFQEELQLLFSALATCREMAEKHSEETHRLTQTFKHYPIANKIGEVTGTALGQMQASGGSYDYEFLTQFSTVLPSYIEQLTQYISNYSSQLVEKEPTLNNEKLAQLRQAGLALLNDLEHLKGNSVFISFKFLKYIHIINNIITLAMSSLEQIGNLSESSQDVIRDNLAKLKYEHLPTLFGLIDKIEVNFMLKPGTLAIPLMDKIKPLYAGLIYYASKPVSFTTKGEELLSIEDSRFLTLRLERTYMRINNAKKALFKIEKAQNALVEFFRIIEQAEYAKTSIHQLPEEIREQLISYYKIVQPYVSRLDIDLNQLLITSLQGTVSWRAYLTGQDWAYESTADNSQSWFSSIPGWIKQSLQKVNGPPKDRISAILAQKKLLEQAINKDQNTQQFHINLNTEVIASVHKQTDLTLFPYCATNNIFILDEQVALKAPDEGTLIFTKDGEHNYLTNPEQLSCEQALSLHHWYDNKHAKFMSARDAYKAFMDLLRAQSEDGILDITQLTAEDKAEYRKLYNQFQPYFINGVPEAMRELALVYDKYLVHALKDNSSLIHKPEVSIFAKLDEHFQHYFTAIDRAWKSKSDDYLEQAYEQFKTENQQTELAINQDSADRAHYVISHTNYSKFIKELKLALFTSVNLFNAPMQAALTCPNKGLPFPELESKGLIEAQIPQVLPFKQLFNSLYHLEAIVLELEELNDKSTKMPDIPYLPYSSYAYSPIVGNKIAYVYRLISANSHIKAMLPALQALVRDPHLSLLGHDLLNKAHALLATIQEQSDAYQQTPDQVTAVEGRVQYNGLWYSLNAFFISPKHIRSLRNNNYLTTEELNDLHARAKQAAITIEGLINNSNSIVQLFLQSPKMLSLYNDLTNKLNEFLSTAHDSVMNNLDKLAPNLFTPLLLEADTWEERIGLKPGTISDPLKKIMDEFHKGLLHPLRLQSQTHIDLICATETLTKRQERIASVIADAEINLTKLEKNYAEIKAVYHCLNNYETRKDQSNSQHHTIELITAYKAALSKLNSLQRNKRIHVEASAEEADFALDELLNQSLKRYEPKLKQIITVIKAGYIHYQSRKATYEMQQATAVEKQRYLQQLAVVHERDRSSFISDYTKTAFDRELITFYERHTGLKHLDKEYRGKLRAYLLQFEESIKDQAKTTADIDATIKTVLQQHTDTFTQKHFASFYHLDNIHKALSQFSDYIFDYRNSIFEDDTTMDKKARRINGLITIASDETKTVDERFKEINYEVNFNPNFGREILAHKHVDSLSLTYLLLCIVSLLEALYLYTPPKNKLYNNIVSATNSAPTSSELLKRFGLFIEIPPKVEQAEPQQVQEREQLDNSMPILGA